MKQILVYSDSLSWGIIPVTRNRLPFAARWPGALEIALNKRGLAVRVVEEVVPAEGGSPFSDSGGHGCCGVGEYRKIRSNRDEMG